MYQLFLGHSSADGELARLIKAEVEATNKATVYLAEDDVQPGADLVAKVKKALLACDAIAVLVTRQSHHNIWVNQEIGFALRDKPAIPLVEKGVDVSSFGMLTGVEHLSFDPASPQAAISDLNAFIAKQSFSKNAQLLGGLLFLVGVLVILDRARDGGAS